MEDYKYFADKNSIENNVKKVEEFFGIIKQFENKDYSQRVELMNKLWSKDLLNQLPKIIYYGDFCSVKIYIENAKYHFDFECKNIKLEEIEKYYPNITSEFSEKYKKLTDLLHPDYFQEDTETNDKIDTMNLLLYKNINININNPQ